MPSAYGNPPPGWRKTKVEAPHTPTTSPLTDAASASRLAAHRASALIQRSTPPACSMSASSSTGDGQERSYSRVHHSPVTSSRRRWRVSGGWSGVGLAAAVGDGDGVTRDASPAAGGPAG